MRIEQRKRVFHGIMMVALRSSLFLYVAAGKSTLLELLSGRRATDPLIGELLFEGVPVSEPQASRAVGGDTCI